MVETLRQLILVLSRFSASFSARLQRLVVGIQTRFAPLLDRERPRRARVAYGARLGLAMLGYLLAALVVYAVVLIPFTPAISDLRAAKIDRPAIVLSADGKELTRFMRFNREWKKLDAISPHVIDALIATEDHRFYSHHGIDFKRTASAALHSLAGDTQGGSTLTQQLARNLFPKEIGRAPTLTRKLKEIITAFKLEYAYSKTEILETYLNTVPFLYNAYGIDMASRTYFGKRASALNLLESATLVGMLKGTAYYNPVRNPERSLERRNVVLTQMVKRGKLSQQQYSVLSKKPVNVKLRRQPPIKSLAPHFTEQVRRRVIQWADENDYSVYADGLVIHTTLSSPLQRLAQLAVVRQGAALQAVADVEWGMASARLVSTQTDSYRYLRHRVEPFRYLWQTQPQLLTSLLRESPEYGALVEAGTPAEQALIMLRDNAKFIAALKAAKTRLEAGFVAIDPATGQVKAWVGGRDFERDGFDHVVDARRQPGSTFKPFVYAAALQKGIRPDDRFRDEVVEFRLKGNEVWRPQDDQPPSGRMMSVRDGLVYSKNTITAQLIDKVGAPRVASLAKALGVNRSELTEVPSLGLGTSPVSLLEMVSAYATIANGGVYHEPIWVTRIEDSEGNVLAQFAQRDKDALPEDTAIELIDMMRGVINQGTGNAIRSSFGIYADVAGKTGTTQNNTDGWFILMHPTLVAGAWVGFNDGRIAFRSNHWGQGAHNALYIVGDFYRRLLRQFSQLETDYQPPHTRIGTLGAWVDRVERLIYGTRPAAGKFGRRATGRSGFDSPFLEEVVGVTGRIERWFGNDEAAPPPKKSPPRALPEPELEPEPTEPDRDPVWRDPPPDEVPVRIIVGPQPQIIIDVPSHFEFNAGEDRPRERGVDPELRRPGAN